MVDPGIAIVGLSCRLPQAADPDSFWRLLQAGQNAITEVPANRWGVDAEGKAGTRSGGFLDSVDQFDPAFFGISPREAAEMDPQQRLLLELSWEALENSRQAPGKLRGERAGVFVGAMWDDYAMLLNRVEGPDFSRYTLTGRQRSIIANRVSYVIGLTGPSFTVDAGQASSLLAVHLACESLRRDECDAALAGGVNLNLSWQSTLEVSEFGGLSPDERCYTFDARANGFVRGEGGALVVLKRYADALAAGDPIIGVIRGSATNNDGASAGLTVPAEEAQQAVVRRACANAGIRPEEVQYVELHGTGTKVGDPIEAAALGATLGAARSADHPLVVGSAKTNIGHLEAAAGITGLIKAVLSIKHRQLPASLGFETPHPLIPLDELNLRVQQELGPWPSLDRPLIAGVSSFGMGGTNCHLVVSEPPKATRAPDVMPVAEPGHPLVWVLSGKEDAALRSGAQALSAHLRSYPDLEPGDVGFSLATTRDAFTNRAALVADDLETVVAGLDALAADRPSPSLVTDVARRDRRSAFLFSGQGSQHAGMGRDLYAAFPAFATAADAIWEHLDSLIGRPLRDIMFAEQESPESALLDQSTYTQTSLFVIEVALFRLLQSWGVNPDFVAGHSVGEIAAAHVAGVLSLADACELVAARARLMQAIPARGAMVAIQASESDVLALLGDSEGRVSIAAVNGPTSTVISGDEALVLRIAGRFTTRGCKTKRLKVSHAFHSAHMDAMLTDFDVAARGLAYRAPRIPIVSGVTGQLVTGMELGPEYWVRQVREPVRFGATVRTLLDQGARTFVEVGPDAVLSGMARDGARPDDGAGSTAAFFPTQRVGRSQSHTVVTALARMHVRGHDVDWDAVFAGHPRRRVDLPTYPFQRKRFWLPDALSAGPVSVGNPDVPVSVGIPDAPVSVPDAPVSVGDPDVAARAADESPAAEDESLRVRLSMLPAKERDLVLLDVVRQQAAVVLGHSDPGGVLVESTFRDLGLDSLGALELGERLEAATGLRLPSSLVFDFPTPVMVIRYLYDRLLGTPRAEGEAALPPVVDDDPIVIVGMACHFPGGVKSPEDLWRLVADGADVIGEWPHDRGWDTGGLHHLESRRGGFLYDADEFDAGFFGISPREAVAMDPQQRLLLETSWEAIERAGIDPHVLRSSRTGVYIGGTHHDYGPRMAEASHELQGYLLTGSSASVMSGRVSYSLGLEGPAVTVDTACSSSLVALHLATQALRSGECDLALAGGVTVMSTPGMFVEFSRQDGLAPDGRCKAFAAGADGTGWSEGVGVLAVERLSDARRFGHSVLAVVEGSAVNQDGASNGLTAPNGPSQQRVIRQALASAGLSASDIDVVEAHGTGTRIGDPIEAHALLATYGQDRPADQPLFLGTVKSNIGHTQAAAGVAGVIKMVLALRHRILPATLHADKPSEHIDWSSGAVALLSEPVPWPETSRRRRAGVSSFGVSGTNAHVIISEAVKPPSHHPVTAPETSGATAWLLSGRSQDAVRDRAVQLSARVAAHPELNVIDVGQSLATTRSLFDHRAIVLGHSRDELLAGLRSLASDNVTASGVVTGIASASPGRTVFVFPGQGAHWIGMGARLLDTSPVFARSMNECAQALAPFVDWSLLDVIHQVDGAPSLDRVDVVQPTSFAVMVSLAALWRSFGVTPDAVVGHSQGEIAAACVAGALSLADAARVVALRSKVIAARLARRGGMLSVSLPVADVLSRLADIDGVEIAAVNGPRSVVVAGDASAVDELMAVFENDGVRVRKISVDYASHTSQVELVEHELARVLAGLPTQAPSVPMFSSVLGEWVGDTPLDGGYWYRNLRHTVRFEDSVRALIETGHRAFIEVSPHPVLVMGVEETAAAADRDVLAVGSLRREHGGFDQFLSSAAKAFAGGVSVDWSPAFAGSVTRSVDLPTYPFQRQRYWSGLNAETRSGGGANFGFEAVGHPVLKGSTDVPQSGQVLFAGQISLQAMPWLADHRALGTAIVPGTAFVEMALFAGSTLGLARLEELILESPLVVPDEVGVQLQLVVAAPDEQGRRPLTVHARVDDGSADQTWTRHASGTLSATDPVDSALVGEWPGAQWPPSGAERVDLADWYERMASGGLQYGPAFQGLQAAWRRDGEVLAEVVLPAGTSVDQGAFELHPALFDAALHAVGLTTEWGSADGSAVRLPFAWTGVSLYAGCASGPSPATVLRVRVTKQDDGARLIAADEAGSPVVSVDLVVSREISAGQLAAARSEHQNSLYQVGWTAITPPKAVTRPGASTYPDPGTLLRALGTRGELPFPEMVMVSCGGASCGRRSGLPGSGVGDGHVIQDVRVAVRGVLELLQVWLADERTLDSSLVFLTSGAVPGVAGDDVADLAGAAVWGLVRSAQTEHPGRIVLLDHDHDLGDHDLVDHDLGDRHIDGTRGLSGLPDLISGLDEPQLALRSDTVSVPRLAHWAPSGTAVEWDPELTLLITGGSGKLAGLVARHAVREWGVRHLLLASRSGEVAPEIAELDEPGLMVTSVVCDVADRESLQGLLAAIPSDHQLAGVIHTAGVLQDTVLTSLTDEQLAAVLRPKVDAAWHLHDLTRDLDLSMFVLFSSVSGLLGGAGQANYAAANAFLDGLALHRRARGLAAVSLAWGLWAENSRLTGALGDRDQQRLSRSGVLPMPTDEALRMLDLSLSGGPGLLAPAHLGLAGIRADDEASPLLRGLTRRPAQQQAAVATESSMTFKMRLAGVPELERARLTLELVRGHSAAVLGHDADSAVGTSRTFKDIGFDSLTAVELRNRLNSVTGLRLTPTAIFDYPTPAALAEHLTDELVASEVDVSVADELDRLEAILHAAAPTVADKTDVAGRLQDMLLRWNAGQSGEAATSHVLDSASTDELLAFIDQKLGS